MGSKPRRQLEIPLHPPADPFGSARITPDGELACGRCDTKRGCKLCRQLRKEWSSHRKLMKPAPTLYIAERTPPGKFIRDVIADVERLGFVGVAQQLRGVIQQCERIINALKPYQNQHYRMRWDRWDSRTFEPFTIFYLLSRDGQWEYSRKLVFDWLYPVQPLNHNWELCRLVTLTGIRMDRRGPDKGWTDEDLALWHWEQRGFTGDVDWRPSEMLPEDHYA